MAPNDDLLAYEILAAFSKFQRANASTYGQIARLVGRERNARLVGRVLSHAEHYGSYPCHRVVNHAGRLVSPVGRAACAAGSRGRDLPRRGACKFGKTPLGLRRRINNREKAP